MAQRIDIAYRIIEGVNDQFDVDYNGLGAQTCTVASGLYMSSKSLAAAVQTAIDDEWSASASFEAFSNSDGTITIDSTSASFDLTWDSISLRNWLGYTGDLSGAAQYISDPQPAVLLESLPWVDDTHGWLWSLRNTNTQHQGQAAKLNRRDTWSVRIFEQRENLNQLRTVLGHLMRGTPATWYRDTTVNTAWGYSNWHGKLEVCADPRMLGYNEAFENPNNLQHILSVVLNMVAI